MRVLIDTNILIDYFGRRQPFFSAWEKLLAMHAFGEVDIWVAPQSFADAFYILEKTVDGTALQQAFMDSLEFLHVCPVGHSEVGEASRRAWKDYEDCLIALCAENVAADYLLTRDERGFRNAETPFLSPDAFFAMLERDYGLVYGVEMWQDHAVE